MGPRGSSRRKKCVVRRPSPGKRAKTSHPAMTIGPARGPPPTYSQHVLSGAGGSVIPSASSHQRESTSTESRPPRSGHKRGINQLVHTRTSRALIDEATDSGSDPKSDSGSDEDTSEDATPFASASGSVPVRGDNHARSHAFPGLAKPKAYLYRKK